MTMEAYVIYYRRNGKKMSEVFSRKSDLNKRRKQLKMNRRKFLGCHQIILTPEERTK